MISAKNIIPPKESTTINQVANSKMRQTTELHRVTQREERVFCDIYFLILWGFLNPFFSLFLTLCNSVRFDSVYLHFVPVVVYFLFPSYRQPPLVFPLDPIYFPIV